jgi:2-dehydro-3-deoxyphosphogluconate aldolase/(4S)-4-hydroxy-2-oxoglutarate aldolase
VLPIARGLSRDVLLRAAGILRSAGIEVMEVTLNSPNAFGSIEALRKHDADLIVGAGTVLNAKAARQAIEAGAQFLVTPHMDATVADAARRSELPVILGALTPTEIITAQAHGAELVKVFPAGILGPEYLRQVLAPLPDARLVPTGGVTVDNAAQFIAAGAVAVGVGSTLLGSRAADAQWLTAQVQGFMTAVQQGRQGGVVRHA